MTLQLAVLDEVGQRARPACEISEATGARMREVVAALKTLERDGEIVREYSYANEDGYMPLVSWRLA